MLTGRTGRLTQVRPRSQGFMLRIAALMTAALFAGLTAARIVEAASPSPSPRPRPLPTRPVDRSGSR